MALKAQYYKHTLNFRFEAGTSRGVLKNKDSYFIKIYDENLPEIFGIGECGPLSGLSPDFGLIAENKLQDVVNQINRNDFEIDFLLQLLPNAAEFPSVCFALESSILNFKQKNVGKIFDNDFYNSGQRIKINGLVWMGTKAFMENQIKEKLVAGFDTIKLKIAAINFEEELDLIKSIRKNFSKEEISIRVDANGGFAYQDSLEKLHRLAKYDIHSIEQPIKAGQEAEMAILCEKSPIPIVLDEELILNFDKQSALLEQIKPQFIIIKPSLMGGIDGTKQWIKTAENLNIKWWITSALESNIGLNAICQLCAEYNNPLAQGLGTGQLYHNNFDSPLEIENGHIFYNQEQNWNLDFFKSN